MRRTRWAAGAGAGLARCLALPAAALADGTRSIWRSTASCRSRSSINTIWVIVAGVLVMFMQAGFAFLEIGFSRAKNAGTGVAKILVNFSIASICLLGGRLRARLRRRAQIAGTHGFFLDGAGTRGANIPLPGSRPSDRHRRRCWFFQFVFCAVSLAIVWGTTLERIKFGVYVIYAIIFTALIYPISTHWIFGGGWLQATSACRTSPARPWST